MTVEQIIKQSKKLTIEEQKNLASYFLLKVLQPDAENLIQLFEYQNYWNSRLENKPKKQTIEHALDTFIGKANNVWTEDAQEYINKLRDDDSYSQFLNKKS